MKKKFTMSTIKEIRRRNMESWTDEDRRFYEDFLDAVFKPKPDGEEKPNPEAAEDDLPAGEPDKNREDEPE